MKRNKNIVIHNNTLKAIASSMMKKYYVMMPSLKLKDEWLDFVIEKLKITPQPKLNKVKHPKGGIIIPVYVLEEIAKQNKFEVGDLSDDYNIGDWTEMILDLLEKELRIEI